MAYRRGLRKSFIALVVIHCVILIWMGYITRIIPGSQALADRMMNKRLTGVSFWTSEIFIYDSERDFNGDGCSTYVFAFNQETSAKLARPDSSFFTQYPNLDGHADWKRKQWRTTPTVPEDSLAVAFALHCYQEGETGRPGADMAETRRMLSEPGNFYAYNFRSYSPDRVNDVNLYILSPARKRFVIVNMNT